MTPRTDLKKIYQAAIAAVDPEKAVHFCLHLEKDVLNLCSNQQTITAFDLSQIQRILVVGAGKATAPMARAIEDILGKKICAGCICVKYGHALPLSFIETIEAAHPLPDENAITGAQKIKKLLESATEKDLVISLISGGGSALLSLPPESVSLGDKQATTDLLIKSGAAIHEINAVRKHLSQVKGGNLAKAAYPAATLNLMVSDVVGDRLDVIASGPFAPDDSTFTQALGVLKKYKLIQKIPPAVLAYITAGAQGKIVETPDKKDRIFDRVTHLIIASNIHCLQAAKKQAEALGYSSLILSSAIEGDTKETADWHTQIAKEVLSSANPLPAPTCIITGGETTVRVKGKGKGGRNMEFALQAAPAIAGLKNILIASIGTDGSDGPTDAAGAVAHGFTLDNAAKLGLDITDYMKRNDAYPFFKALGDLVITGPTQTNVMDIRIILVS
ncbi:MAG: glycerate kinase [Proteobacteria bacterium]|nr:glycerate kinase [Desulfobacula sp.]MBU3954757.1 glycerate kinase [Pseudomonadota bacterium]MBU4131945.1 glycerate kinase [Pseudomonadota bacterium]